MSKTEAKHYNVTVEREEGGEYLRWSYDESSDTPPRQYPRGLNRGNPHRASERYEELIDNLDPQLKGKADYGASAARKATLSRIPVPNHLLDSIGVDVPHRTYLDDADNRVTRKTTVDIDGTKVHLHQDVREADDGDDAFGSFGAAEEDTDDVVWTVVNLDNGTVTLKVVGEWGKSRDPTYEEFADEYEPVYCTTEDGEKVVRFGY